MIDSLLLTFTLHCRWGYEAKSTSSRDASRLSDAARSAAARAGQQQRAGAHAAATGRRAAHAEDARLATRAAAAGDGPDQRALWYVPPSLESTLCVRLLATNSLRLDSCIGRAQRRTTSSRRSDTCASCSARTRRRSRASCVCSRRFRTTCAYSTRTWRSGSPSSPRPRNPPRSAASVCTLGHLQHQHLPTGQGTDYPTQRIVHY